MAIFIDANFVKHVDIGKFHAISAIVLLKPCSQVLLRVAGGQVPETEVADQEEVDYPQRSQCIPIICLK